LIARPASNLGSSVDVDHPFLFAIVERKTGLALLLGRVVDPTGG